MIITAQWEGMGDAGSVRYELALLPPCQTSYNSYQKSPHSILSEFSVTKCATHKHSILSEAQITLLILFTMQFTAFNRTLMHVHQFKITNLQGTISLPSRHLHSPKVTWLLCKLLNYIYTLSPTPLNPYEKHFSKFSKCWVKHHSECYHLA